MFLVELVDRVSDLKKIWMELDLLPFFCMDRPEFDWRTWFTAGTMLAISMISLISGTPAFDIPIDLANPRRLVSSIPFHTSCNLSG